MDNNLPLSLARRMDASQDEVKVQHVVDLGMQHHTDDALRGRWQNDDVIWVTRDEDFWLDAPATWAVVWVAVERVLRDRFGVTARLIVDSTADGLQPQRGA